MESAILIGALGAAWTLAKWSSPSVRRYRRVEGERLDLGALSVRRRPGPEHRTVVLLHGLLGTGDTFGGDFDRLSERGTLLVPDHLGFGRSLDTRRRDFGHAAHLDALDALLGACPDESRLVVAGHSLGGVLALSWAARHVERVDAVVTWGAPLFRSREEGVVAIESFGVASRLLALDTPASRWMCALMCRHRAAAGWLAALASPRLPVHIARQGVLHSWHSYRGALEGVLLSPRWRGAVEVLGDRGVPVTLVRGARDPVAIAEAHLELARAPSIEHVERAGEHHDLPLRDPRACVVDVLSALPLTDTEPLRPR